jgi:hypothetical protein
MDPNARVPQETPDGYSSSRVQHMRKTWFVLILGAALFGGGMLTSHHLTPVRTVHAQSGCDASTLSGAYGYNLTGYVYDSQGYSYFLASAGRLVPDGGGGLSGTETLSFDGTIVHRTYTGTYTMNDDCTGSMVWQVTQGNSTVTVHADIVAVNNAREINFVQTDQPFIFSGVFKKQTQ